MRPVWIDGRGAQQRGLVPWSAASTSAADAGAEPFDMPEEPWSRLDLAGGDVELGLAGTDGRGERPGPRRGGGNGGGVGVAGTPPPPPVRHARQVGQTGSAEVAYSGLNLPHLGTAARPPAERSGLSTSGFGCPFCSAGPRHPRPGSGLLGAAARRVRSWLPA